jgi:hypothetical protein
VIFHSNVKLPEGIQSMRKLWRQGDSEGLCQAQARSVAWIEVVARWP